MTGHQVLDEFYPTLSVSLRTSVITLHIEKRSKNMLVITKPDVRDDPMCIVHYIQLTPVNLSSMTYVILNHVGYNP